MSRFRLPVLVLFVVLAHASTGHAELRAEVFVSGLSEPVGFVRDPSNSAVQYVVEQGGRIRIIVDGVLRSSAFLDLSSLVSGGSEQGLLGLAFAPDYASSRRFFVFYTRSNGDIVVARYKRSPTDPLVADPSSGFGLRWGGPSGDDFILHTGAEYGSNHNGGSIVFGPDGYLYIAIGDGGQGGDPYNHAQTPTLFVGKILRIDVSVGDSDPQGYRVPADNPFVGDDPIDALDEIWSIGLRNPWRITFDDPALGGTGAMLIGDVGQSAREEIDHEPAGTGGRNYGWRIREGSLPFNGTMPAASLPLTDPFHEYDRLSGRAVTGGYVYRGAALPSTSRGRYFFADYATARVWSIALTIGGTGEATASDLREHTEELGGPAFLGNISSFGVDAAGELYLVSRAGGRILRVFDGCGYTIAPSSHAFTGSGDRLSIAVAAASDCSWTSVSNASWITITSGGSGIGDGTVDIQVAPNTTASGRSGTVTVAGRTFTATQASATVPVADFNGDGRLDILLWHARDGFVGAWLMEGTTLLDGILFTPNRVGDTRWTIVGSADIDGDGRFDLLWQHDDGSLAVWFMDGATRLEVAFLSPSRVPDPDWRVRAVGDLDGDGHADLILQHRATATLAVWLLDGTTLLDGRLLTPSHAPSPMWEVVGAGEFDGDGQLDLVLQHRTEGWLGVWFMNGTTLVDGRLLDPARLPDPAWRVRGVGDLDGNGHPDLILQHAGERTLGVWLMMGTTLLDGRLLAPSRIADPFWEIVGPR